GVGTTCIVRETLVDSNLSALDAADALRIDFDLSAPYHDAPIASQRDGSLPALENDFVLANDSHASPIHLVVHYRGEMIFDQANYDGTAPVGCGKQDDHLPVICQRTSQLRGIDVGRELRCNCTVPLRDLQQNAAVLVNSDDRRQLGHGPWPGARVLGYTLA